MLRNPEAAAAAAEAGCLEAVLEVMAADEAPAADDPRNAAQWVQRQVPSSLHGYQRPQPVFGSDGYSRNRSQ